MKTRISLLLLVLLTSLPGFSLPIVVPEEIQKILLADHPTAKFRMDGVLKEGEKLWLPLNSGAVTPIGTEPIKLLEKTDRGDYLFSSGWIYLPVESNSLKAFDYYPETFQKQLLQSRIIQEFIVPKDFELPRDLAMLAGRLPLKLKAVELASEREVSYKARIKDAVERKIFDFLAYSYADHKLYNLALNKSTQNGTDIQPNITEIKGFDNQEFAYLSNIRKFDDVYIIERNKAKIYRVKKVVEADNFDAKKPLKNKVEVKAETSFVVEEFLSLTDFELSGAIEDIVVSPESKTAYILTSEKNALVVVNYEAKKLIKVIDLPSICSGLQLISRSSLEPDKIVFYSRSKNSIFIVNTFDYRIAQEIDLTNINKSFRFIPHALLINEQYVFVATEAVSRDPKLNGRIYGKLLVLDVITGAFVNLIDLDAIPTQMVFSKDKEIFLMSENNQGQVSLKKIDPKTHKPIAELALDADFAYPKTFDLGSTGDFLLIPSSTNPIIGLVDTKEMKLVKKINLGSNIQIVKSI